MSKIYEPAHRALQDRFDSRRIADRLEEKTVRDALSDDDIAFVRARDMVFVATCDATGQPTCSIKCGDAGFIAVADARTLELPWYDGNGMFLTAGNIIATRKIGLLFIDLEAPQRLRVEGDASMVSDAEIVATHLGAQFVLRVAVTRVYPNCPRYIPSYQRRSPSIYLPRPGATPPVPAWKKARWARDVLPREP
jgi:predicted pyridoxine 5'-phosphate oxidase superfamily flavin-nucleotide-binding protein